MTPEEHAATIVMNIRLELIRQGKRQEDLAAALGQRQAWVSRRLRKPDMLSVLELIRVADFLGVPVSRLMETDG